MVDMRRPCLGKISAQRSIPCENSRTVHISSYNSGFLTDSEKSSIEALESRPWAFQRAINQGRASAHNFSKMGFSYPNLSFLQKLRPKQLKVCYIASLPKNFQRWSCSAIEYLSYGINILAGDDPVPGKFGPKGTDPNTKDAHCLLYTSDAADE